jgi:hypothetical protein
MYVPSRLGFSRFQIDRIALNNAMSYLSYYVEPTNFCFHQLITGKRSESCSTSSVIYRIHVTYHDDNTWQIKAIKQKRSGL